MKRKAFIFTIFIGCIGLLLSGYQPVCAAPVGNSLQISTPPQNYMSKSRSVALALDLEENGGSLSRIKAGVSLEFVIDKDFKASSEVSDLELDSAQWYMGKVSYTVNKHIEPYLTFGMTSQKFKWNQGGTPVEVDSDKSFAWGAGTKLELWDFKEQNIKLYADVQYRETEPELDSITVNGTSAVAKGGTAKVREWQRSLVVSRELDRYMRGAAYRFIPYAGLTWSDSDIDLSFTNSGTIYDLYDAGNENKIGVVAGCDILPQDSSSYAVNVETRFVDEMSVTAGGVVRF